MDSKSTKEGPTSDSNENRQVPTISSTSSISGSLAAAPAAAEITKPEFQIDYEVNEFTTINLDENDNKDSSEKILINEPNNSKSSTPTFLGGIVRNLLTPTSSNRIPLRLQEIESPNPGNDNDEVGSNKRSNRDGTTESSMLVIAGNPGAEDNPNQNLKTLDHSGKRRKDPGGDDNEDLAEIPLFYQIVNCNRQVHHVSPRLRIPFVRARFLSKIMSVKSLQWTILIIVITGMLFYSKVKNELLALPEIGYIFMIIYFTTVVCSRALIYGQSILGAVITLFIETTCLCYIFGQILFTCEDYIIPGIAYSIALTNISLAILCFYSKADVSENSSIYSKALSLGLFSTAFGMFLATIIYPPETTFAWVKKLTTMCLLDLMITETYVLTEISDIHFILKGYRFAVNDEDWFIVSASLF